MQTHTLTSIVLCPLLFLCLALCSAFGADQPAKSAVPAVPTPVLTPVPIPVAASATKPTDVLESKLVKDLALLQRDVAIVERDYATLQSQLKDLTVKWTGLTKRITELRQVAIKQCGTSVFDESALICTEPKKK